MANEFVIKNGYLSKADSQITGSLFVSGAVSASTTPNTVGFYGTASWAASASWAPKTPPGGLDTQIQFNSASAFSGSSNLTFDYTNNKLVLTGSLSTTGSNTLIGNTYLTGSLNITGSTLQVGNNTLLGNTTLSGSIIISGSHLANTPTIKIYGDVETDGAIKFLPVSYDIDPSISGSYIFVSGSTDDLYFSQNGAGYSNTTRLRWLEGNLYTGLLNGGIITATLGTNTYQISSGSGIIVALNSSYNANPYPIIQYINWGNLTNTIDALSGSFDQQFIAISSSAGTAVIKAQGIPYQDGDYNNFIPIGIVIHQNRSTINAVQTFPGVAYGWKQRSFDFLRAFGPLKISGYTLAQSGSSTRGLVLSGGTAWVDGRNYIVDPNNPSYITEATGIVTSKIYRYYQSGSNWQSNWGYNTNAGAGFTDIDPTQYSNVGTLTPVGSNKWTIQRVFYFPNSATKAFYIYYGNAEYANEADALAAVNTETFNEAPNTAANAIYVGYMLLRNDATFTVPASYTFYAAGLFRASGIGGGSGGGGGATTLAGLTDVSLSSLVYGDLLMYNGITSLWNNTKTLSGSYTLSGSLTTNDGLSVQTVTASFISASSITGSLHGTASWADSASNAINAQTASFLPVGTYNITASWANSASQALTASFLPIGTYQITASWAQSASNAINAQTASFLPISTYQITASWAQSASQALTASFLPVGTYNITASWAQSSSNSINAQTASFLPIGTYNITSSWAQSASNTINAQTASFLPVGTYNITASWAQSSSQAVSASYVKLLAGPNITINYQSNGIAITGSGGGTPGGADKTIQFNDSSNFSGSSNFTFDKSTDTVQLSGSLIVSNSINSFGYLINSSTGYTSVDWLNYSLYDNQPFISVDWLNRQLKDISQNNSIDWDSRQALDSTGAVPLIDWGSQLLNDSVGNASVNWQRHELVYNGMAALDWDAYETYDTLGSASINWNARRLFDQTGTNIALEFTDTGSSNGVRLYGTASYALDALSASYALSSSRAVTSSFALTASYVNGMIIKSGKASSFSGTPQKATVTFSTNFPNTNYTVTLTGNVDARSWTAESLTTSSFVINSNSNTALTGGVYWQAISIGEFSQ